MNPQRAIDLAAILPGNSEMARRMRGAAWERSGLGAPEHWSGCLRVALGVCVTSRIPTQVLWGPALTFLYNDATIPLLGSSKHPSILGRPAREAWGEVWNAIGPVAERVLADGDGSCPADVPVFVDRDVPREEAYVTISLTPIFGEAGTVDGLFCTCTETTAKVVGDRRMETLRKLGAEATVARRAEAACAAIVNVLDENSHDVPLAALYLISADGAQAQHVASAGASTLRWDPPAAVSLTDDTNVLASSLRTMLQTKRSIDVTLDWFDVDQASGAPRRAIMLPVAAGSQDQLAGFLVAMPSDRRPLDGGYRTFLDLVAGHIASALAGARAFDEERGRVEERRAAERQIKSLFERVVSIQEQERRRIAREIHDQLGQEITALRMTLELIRGRASFDLQLMAEARQAERLAQNLDRSIDFLTSELWPTTLDHLGLSTALASLLADWSKRFDIPADFESPIVDDLQLPRDIATNLYRIAQEALHNIVKHAHAKHVAVLLAKRKSEMILVIEDDGRGFDASAKTTLPDQLGLISMRERAVLAGGTLEVDSVRGRGTTIFVRVPMNLESEEPGLKG